MTSHASGSARRLVILGRWRAWIGWRGFRRVLLDTFQGRAMLVVFIVSTPILAQLLSEGGISNTDALGASVVMGALVFSQMALSVCLVVMVPLALIRSFVLERRSEPLLAHPSILPELAVLQVGGTILWSTLFLGGSFYVFYAQHLMQLHDRPWWSLFAHIVSWQIQFMVIGVLVAAAFRTCVRGRKLPERMRLLHRASIAPFLVIYPAFVVVPLLLAREAPHTLAMLAERSAGMLHVMQPPLVISGAVAKGSVTTLLVVASSLLLAGFLALRAVWRWAPNAPAEVPLDLVLEARAHHTSVLTRASRDDRSRVPEWRLFWIKDVTLPVSRDPRVYLEWQGLLLIVGWMLMIAVAKAFGSDVIDEGMATAAHAAVIMITAALIVMPRTLGCLGREGRNLALLKPVMSARKLFLIKWLVALRYGLLHAIAHAGVLTTIAWTLGTPIGWPWASALEAGAATLGLSAVGTALGFLVPDFRRSGWVLPGASDMGKLLFGLVTAGLVTSYGLARYLLAIGHLGGPGFSAWIGSIALAMALVAVVIAGAGVRKLETMEP